MCNQQAGKGNDDALIRLWLRLSRICIAPAVHRLLVGHDDPCVIQPFVKILFYPGSHAYREPA